MGPGDEEEEIKLAPPPPPAPRAGTRIWPPTTGSPSPPPISSRPGGAGTSTRSPPSPTSIPDLLHVLTHPKVSLLSRPSGLRGSKDVGGPGERPRPRVCRRRHREGRLPARELIKRFPSLRHHPGKGEDAFHGM